MRKLISWLPLLFVQFSYCQQNPQTKAKTIAGTNLVIQLPEGFVETSDSHGFENSSDSIKITGFQTNKNISIEEAIKQQQQAITDRGFSIVSTEPLVHENLKGCIINFKIIGAELDGLCLIFGEENSQNILISLFPKSRRNEAKEFLLSTETDKSLTPKYNLGFKTVGRAGSLVQTDTNSISLSYEQKNKSGEVVSILKLFKLPKDESARDAVNRFSTRLFPGGAILSDEVFNLDSTYNGFKTILKTTKKNGYPQYNYLVSVGFDSFILMAIGSANVQSDIKNMDIIVKSIKVGN